MTTFEISMSIISVIASIGVFSALYRIGHTVGITEESVKNLNIKFDNLPCDKHEETMQNINRLMDKLPCEAHEKETERLMKKLDDTIANMPCSNHEEIMRDIKRMMDKFPCEAHEKETERLMKKLDDTIANMPCSNHEEIMRDIKRMMDKFPCEAHEKETERLMKKLDDTIANMPCDKHSEKIQNLREDVLTIQTFLTSKFKSSDIVWGYKRSPTTLNENGLKLFEAIKGDAFLAEHKNFFLEKIAAKKPKTPYDVENKAHEVLIENTDNDIYNDLKNWLYYSPAMQITDEKGTRKYVVTLLDVCYVLGISLRDIYLSSHPELLPKTSNPM